MLNRNNTREVIRIVIEERHPKECIFNDNAVDAATYWVMSQLRYDTSKDKLLDLIEYAILEQEIYCPHEGIDKRKL